MEGDRTTPSIVAFGDDGEVVVGQPAKRQAVTNPQNTLYAVKRLIGRRFDEEAVQKDIKLVPYKIIKADNGDAWVEAAGEKMAPPEVAARVLMKMKEAVITVPAYFNDSQRQATKDAGRIAGLDVLSTNGDTFLGGEDFDNRLIDYLADEFKKEKLEALVEDLVQRTIEPCRTALKDAGLSASDINDVIMVGGQTRMPKVQEVVKDFFGKEPRKDDDNQTAVTVHVLQGEREIANGNKSLGRFDLADIPPAPRGVPQVEVSFDIDANGIMNVSAKDKATGKVQSIVIKASSGLSDEEIQRMVTDAETHAAEDAKMREIIDTRNQAEQMIHATEKSMTDLADQIEEAERTEINAKVEDLRSVLSGDDKEAIDTKLAALTEVTSKLAERAYSQQQAEGAPTDAGGDDDAGPSAAADDAVDAEFEEVKDDKAS
ncbi:UNVERIFIED_CONTAM: hypothetical protein GTU68_038795 [Idotea baltica]|nr:hypothetical protein [Idotea baltica]